MDKPDVVYNDEAVTISKLTLIRLCDLGYEATALFIFYLKTAIIQRTNSVWALDSFCQKGLRIPQKKFKDAKNLLIKNGLIEIKKYKNKDGTFGKHYILIHYLPTTTISSISLIDHERCSPQVVDTADGVSKTNALDKKGNALDLDKKGNALDKKLNATKIAAAKILDHWNKKNIKIHPKLTDNTLEIIINTLNKISEDGLIECIDNYSDILKSDEHYFSYKWTLADFLSRGLSKGGLENRKGFWMFRSEEEPHERFKNTFTETDPYTEIKNNFKPRCRTYNQYNPLNKEENTYYGYNIDLINNPQRLYDTRNKVKVSAEHWKIQEYVELEAMIVGLLFRRKREDNLEEIKKFISRWKELAPMFEEYL